MKRAGTATEGRQMLTAAGGYTPGGGKEPNAWVPVYEFLKERIVNGTYTPGEKLNERDLARLVNVSRTPVREALRVLEHEGFVTNVAKKGVSVKKYSIEELDTLHRMLIRLESLAVEMAAPRLSERDIATLESMTNRLQSLASKKRYIEYLTLNFEFHLFFAKVSGSKELYDAIAALRKRVFRFYHAHIMLAHDPDRYVQFHREIIDALKKKNRARPEKIMEKHIEHARKSFLDFYRGFGVTTGGTHV
jgi:DNA-binding GntR family transcriptional regulator